MKVYEVCTLWGLIRVHAEKIIRHTVDDKPVKITFQIEDEIVAEYYAIHTAGWREIREEE